MTEIQEQPLTKRRMLFCERLMYVDGRTPINCVVAARISGQLSEENLRFALCRVQQKHALLRATIQLEDGLPAFFFQEDPAPIPVRIIERTSDDDWRTANVAEWKDPFDMTTAAPIRLVWVRSDSISELLLVAHHCLTDGSSLITIFREILEVADQPNKVLAPYAPFRSLEQIIPAEIFHSKKTRRIAKIKASIFRLYARTLKDEWNIPKYEHYFLHWRASVEESAALSRRCKAEGITPYSALCVAALMAFREVGKSRKFKNKLICPVDVRHFVKDIRSDMMFNYAPTISLKLSKDAGDDFWTQAKQIKQAITKKVANLSVYGELMGAEMLHDSLSKLIGLLLRSNGTYDFALSNVGKLNLPEDLQHFKVTEVLGITVGMPWRNATTLVTSHFRGQTDLVICSNESFLPQAEAIVIQNRAIEILRAAIHTAEDKTTEAA